MENKPRSMDYAKEEKRSKKHQKAWKDQWKEMKKNDKKKCWVHYSVLHPTQLVLGLAEVELKKTNIRTKDEDRLRKWLKNRRVPVVIGPKKKLYMIDRHHSVRAVAELDMKNKKKLVPIEIKHDCTHMSKREFQEFMIAQHWTYLYKDGSNPYKFEDIPKNVCMLDDDPYRSLAWAVEKRGGFHKVGYFCEFKWSDFLRKHIPMEDVQRANIIWDLVAHAMDLCQTSVDAVHLPGYLEPEHQGILQPITQESSFFGTPFGSPLSSPDSTSLKQNHD
eukprot:TRINITY_DN5081_c0_g1_i2.p1 TRINITY_DN5081_c0_g1~~TRINITY_DN5081_c0_g1_i2.p1  ORF type:complete len:276 (-),score=36.21 TRINITY_DN5081_c0_g1_i2:21-848(-)